MYSFTLKILYNHIKIRKIEQSLLLSKYLTRRSIPPFFADAIFHSTIGWERMRSRMSVSENSFSGE